MKERREFYRIDDKVALNYRIIPEHEVQAELENSHNGIMTLRELRNAVYCIDARLDDITNLLSRDHPLLSETIVLLNKKIALHERMMGFSENDKFDFNPAMEINLSASGAAFAVESAMDKGTYLKIEMVLYPENYYILLYARVLSCNKDKEREQNRYRIAVEFEVISEKDQEKIMQHILSKQANDIKQQRSSREDPAEVTPADAAVIKLIK